jgi:hypothetical protein
MIPPVEEALVRAGLNVLEALDDQGWSACVATRPASTRSPASP